MKKIEIKDLKAYAAPGHFGMTAMRIHGKEEDRRQQILDGPLPFSPRRRCRMGL